jgi:hypothetical protein
MSNLAVTPEQPTHEPAQSPTKSIAQIAAAPVYLLAIFLGASLVFSVQPMFAKMVLPVVGGSAAVWNVALVFFQGALLAGYAYAHCLQKLPLQGQLVGHLTALALAGLFLPMAAAAGFETPPESGQALWLIALFAASVGAPFMVISATAPLLQAWFSKTGRKDAADPYFLYAASNAGSLIALVAYPLALEPFLGAQAQSEVWTFGYVALGVLIAACGLLTLSLQRKAVPAAVAAPVAQAGPAAKPTWTQRGMWTLYAFAPSMLLVAASTHITTDVASAPLLWVAPLALYLLAFITAFMKKPLIAPRFAMLFHLVLTVSALILSWTYVEWTALLTVTLLALFFGVLVCCQELYRRRPEASGLTEFYMWMSVGGVLGGAFAALAAPLLFDTVAEYPLALALTLALRPWGEPTAKILIRLAIGAALVSAALVAAPRLMDMPIMPMLVFAGMGLMVAAMVCVQRHPFALAGCALSVFAIGDVFTNADNIFAERGFYGVMSVNDTPDGAYRLFTYGTTVHGVQRLDPARALEPGAYYGPRTPIGQVFETMGEAGLINRVVAVGLGVGSTSCYATPEQSWTFYEIDPLVVEVATNPNLFTLLSGCAPQAEIRIGDGRLLLQDEPAGSVDVLLVDAFSSDAVPTHLLTQEAMALYLSRLSSHGVAVIHISNRNLALSDIVVRAVEAAGGVAVEQNFRNPVNQSAPEGWTNLSSQAVAIAADAEDLAPLLAAGQWRETTPSDRRVWTDDYTNILEPLMARMAETRAN